VMDVGHVHIDLAKSGYLCVNCFVALPAQGKPNQKYLKFQLPRAACSNFCVGYPRMALVPPVLRSA
jgi:hypothetical protein